MASKINVCKVTAEEYKKLEDFVLDYGVSQTRFGPVLLALNKGRVCYISFIQGDIKNVVPILSDLKKQFPNATLAKQTEKVVPEIEKIFSEENAEPIDLLLKGTHFETTVWETLLSLKKGSTFSYQDVAVALNNPNAIRAVAKAVAKNKLAYVVPCHRVISKSGGLSKYQWGADRKLKLLKDEKAI